MLDLSPIQLKVCGLRDNIEEVVDLRPGFIGLIFYPKSSRYVGDLDVSIVRQIPKYVKKVGVFVNETKEEVSQVVDKYDLDLVQLHGEESQEYCAGLKARGIRLVKVFSGNNLPGRKVLDAYSSFIDYYLFDTRGATYGGTGKTFDWRQLKDLHLKKPVFISGGISLDNISQLSGLDLDLFAVDVNSKFEVSPGLKDIEALRKLRAILG